MEAINMVLEILERKAREGKEENNFEATFYYTNAANILREGINGNIDVLQLF